MMMEFGDCAPDTAALERMSKAMVHRGPDDAGQFVSGRVALAFRRLSIIDTTTGGHQPMADASGRYSIVFNGEIYNYVELRQELIRAGHVFTSSSDTEVLLNAYTEWKEHCLERLNGMWAFVIYDKSTGECFCARDRFGIKPLYYRLTAERIIVASETATIRASGLYSAKPDLRVVSAYLFLDQLDTTQDTFDDEIKSLEPGTCMWIESRGKVRRMRYWTLPDEHSTQVDIEALRDTFLDAVRLRLRSDVPVGVFLSGGMDSTSILCAMSRQMAGHSNLNAYSYMSGEFDERKYIEATIAQTGATLVPLRVDTSELWQQLLAMSRYQDAPVHTPSALIGYNLARRAAEDGVKVILNGQGADETFAGYSSYFRIYWYTLLAKAKVSRLWKELQAYGGYYGVPAHQLLRRVFVHFVRAQLNGVKAYRALAAARRQRALAESPFYSAELAAHVSESLEVRRAVDLGSVLKDAIRIQPLPLYLRIEDRNSMASSIEERLPFLDYRLVTMVMEIWAGLKIEGMVGKAIQRAAMIGVIPEVVRTRVDKMGFPTPDAYWVRQWSPHIEEIFRSQSFRERGFFKVDKFLDALKLHTEGVADYHWEIFKALQLELWLRAVDQDAGSHILG